MGFDSYMCGRCHATGFARQAELDDHARRCAEREAPTMGAKRCSCIDAQRAYLEEAAACGKTEARGRGTSVLNLGTASGRVELGSIFVPEKASRKDAFTRAEVLAVVRAERARQANNGIHTAAFIPLDALIAIFEGME